MSENPFFHRGPVKSCGYFYGRTRETKRALQLLRNGQSVSIVGPRKIGKTSLLLHLMDERVLAEHGMRADGSARLRYLCVYINGETLGTLTKVDVYRTMLEELDSRLRATLGSGLTLDPGGADTDVWGELAFHQFSRALRRLTSEGLRILFLVDEFEALSSNSRLGEDFFSSLRSLTLHDVAFATASQHPLLDLTLRREVLSSPFFNIFALLQLGLFQPQEARAFVAQGSGEADCALPAELAESLIDLVGLHPFCLQVACYHACDRIIVEGRWPEVRDPVLEESIQADLVDHYSYSVSRLSDEEKLALARVSQAGTVDLPFELAQRLGRQCLVVRALTREGQDLRAQVEYRCQSRALRSYLRHGLAPSWEAAISEGARRLATILFVDLVDFTTLADKRKPEEIMRMVKRVTRLFTDPVEQYGGSVIQFRGDGILALFGVPVERQDDAERAVRASLEMQHNLDSIGAEIGAQYSTDLRARIGLNTGVIVVGEMGNPQRSIHTAMGDAVNLAERMQRMAEPGGIVMSESTYQQVRGRFRVHSLGPTMVKGKPEPVRAYSVMSENVS
jgi:class 3 adenylate cyclase